VTGSRRRRAGHRDPAATRRRVLLQRQLVDTHHVDPSRDIGVDGTVTTVDIGGLAGGEMNAPAAFVTQP
jgi:hypothetical protein